MQKIYNTITTQECIATCLIAILFVAQPFSGISRVPLFVLTGIGVWICLRDKEKIYRTSFYQLGIISLLFLIPGLISFWNTYSPEKTAYFVFIIMVCFYFSGVAIISTIWNDVCFKLLTAIISITSCLWVIDAIYELCVGKDMLGIPVMPSGRLSGPFSDSTHLGVLLVVLLPVTLSWLEKYNWILTLTYLTGLVFVLIFADVRTDLVTFMIAVPLYYMWTRRGRFTLLFILLPIILSVAGISFLIAQARPYNVSSVKSVEKLIDSSFSYKQADKFLSGRLDIWMTAWNMTKENPVTGVGAKAFNYAFEEYEASDQYNVVDGKGGAYHAHHPWVSMVAEKGIVGLFGFIGVIVLMFSITTRNSGWAKFHTYPWLLSFVLLINPLNSMPILFKTWWFPIVLLVIVAHLVDVAKKKTT